MVSYESQVRAAFPNLGDIPTQVLANIDHGVLAFRPVVLAAARSKLILSVFDLVGLLTKIHLSVSHNEMRPAVAESSRA